MLTLTCVLRYHAMACLRDVGLCSLLAKLYIIVHYPAAEKGSGARVTCLTPCTLYCSKP